MRRAGDTSIRSRIWQLAGLACSTLVVLGLLLAWSVVRSREAAGWVEHARTVLEELAGYTREIVDVETAQRGYLLTLQAGYLIPYDEARNDSKVRLARLNALITDGAERRKLQRLAGLFDDNLREVAGTIALAEAGKPQAALAILRDGQGRTDTSEFQRLGREIADGETRELAKRQAAAQDVDRTILVGIVLDAILAIWLILGAAARTVARIDGPLRDLLQGIGDLSDGDLDRRVDVRTRDEIGKVAKAFNDMADRLVAANQARKQFEADLAGANRRLVAEVEQRSAAQIQLSRSMVELRRSNEELDNFAYGASHDLKAPLRGIRNLTEWISDDIKDTAGKDTMENVALLHSRVERLDLLLDSLLQYSRVGRAGGIAEDVDTGQMIDDIADYISPKPGFTVACRGALPVIHTNKAPLEQVLRNLIGNGLKHHDRDTGSVTVSARDQGDFIEFRVEDDGPGIPPEFHERIFQMFQTLKSRDELEGSGMGLAIVKKSVEAHGGTITVESASPRGTIFVFTWAKDRQALAA